MSAQAGEPRPCGEVQPGIRRESGTSGPDEGVWGCDMPELALLGVGWRRGPTQSPPLGQGLRPSSLPTPPTKYMQINANICNVSPPPGPAPARGECLELCQSLPTGGLYSRELKSD